MAIFYLLSVASVFIYFTHCFSLSDTEVQNVTNYFVDGLSGKDSDVFRQLLNQETLIRMSLVKNVHSLMQDMVVLKQDMVTMQSTMDTVTNEEINGLKKEVEQLKRDNKRLSDENSDLRHQLVLVYNTFEMVEKNASQMKTDSIEFEERIEENRLNFEQNISGILSDIKTEVRYMSFNLLNLNDHSLEMDKNIPKLFEQNSRSILEWVNGTFERLNEDITDTNDKQQKLETSVSRLEAFQLIQANNTSILHDNITTTINDIQVKVQQYLQEHFKLSSIVKSLQLSHLKKGVGFTAGVTSTNSGFSGSTLVFNKILYEVGGGYSSSTGIFTSPTDGTFVFYITIQSYGSNYIYFDIVLNGDSKVRAMANPSSYKTGTNMVILQLHKGDKVWARRSSGTGYYTEAVPIITFSGFLIHGYQPLFT